MTTRAEFLDQVRRQVQRAPVLFAASTAARPARPAEAAEAVRRQMSERWREALQRFQEEFERVGGVFHRVARLADVPAVIAELAAAKSATRLVAWDQTALGLDLAAALGPTGLAVAAPHGADDADRRRHLDEAARADIGVTGCDLAVAETGTMILISGHGRPRSTSLLPATHVALFDQTRLVESLEQVGVMLEAWHGEPAATGSGINFITGPSRTADIELTLTRGVHGPKDVHAVFVERA
jgi:L-lactate dehydrogenase complex protein LldG